jgi:hypothetical protein
VKTSLQCYLTAGQPYSQALAKAEREGIPLPNTIEHLKTQASAYLLKTGEAAKPPQSFWSFLDPDTSALHDPQQAQGLGDSQQQQQQQQFQLPSRHLPSFWPLFTLGALATLHALVVLLQVWVVHIRCWVQFTPVDSVALATHVKVRPLAGLCRVAPCAPHAHSHGGPG